MKVDEQFEEYPYIEEQGSFLWIIFIISAFLLFFIISGITYSLYDNVITGKKTPVSNVLFNYSDVNGQGNGIAIKNAKDVSDTIGKHLSGSGNTFEFTISGNTKQMSANYMIVLEKEEASTIADSDIKVYLTQLNGTLETEVSKQIPLVSELEDVNINGKTYKKLYSVSLPEGLSTFHQDYVLRMWIRENAEDYYGKNYSLKVHVLTEEDGE